MILHKIMDAKAPCGTHRSGAVKVFSFSDFDFAEPFGSAFFLPRGILESFHPRHPERSEGSRPTV